MGKNNSSKADFANLTQSNGRRLAFEMLVKYSKANTDTLSIEARYRPGKPQRDILGLTLRTIRKAGNPAVEAGFMAVMNDFLAHALTGGVVEPEHYEALDDAEIEREYTNEEIEGPALITRGHLTLVHSRA